MDQPARGRDQQGRPQRPIAAPHRPTEGRDEAAPSVARFALRWSVGGQFVGQEPSSPCSRRSDKGPRFPACGSLALAALLLGFIALAVFLRYSGEMHPQSSVLDEIPSLIRGVRGPT